MKPTLLLLCFSVCAWAQSGGLGIINGVIDLSGATETDSPTPATGDASKKIASTLYVSNALASINPAVAVQAATVSVLSNTPTYSNGTAGVGATLTATSFGALTIDGYTVLLNDRVLIKTQASTFQNGVYTLTTLGTGGVDYVLTRATDYNSPTNINYTGTIPVLQGSTLSNTGWNLTTQVSLIGTNALTYTQAAAGNAGGPPGGNVKCTGNLVVGDVLTGAGGKTCQDSGVPLSSLATVAGFTTTYIHPNNISGAGPTSLNTGSPAIALTVDQIAVGGIRGIQFRLPNPWTGNITVNLDGTTTGTQTTGTVVIVPSAFCVADGGQMVGTPFNVGSSTTKTFPTTSGQFEHEGIALSPPTTGCAAGNLIIITWKYDSSSTYGGPINVYGALVAAN